MARRQINQRITADIVPMELDLSDDDNDESQDMFQVPQLKRKLLHDFGRPSVIEPPVSEHMKVYLRIRPFTEDELNKGENQNCLSIDTSQTVTTSAPKDSHYFKNTTRGFGRTNHKYTFSHIFNDDTSQKEFFNQTMLGLVKDFIDGQNCLVFSYGVTNSGKTYTIQGNAKDGGVLPRALDVLFNSISGQQWDGMNLKPDLFMSVTRLKPDQELMERKIKERVMKLSCEDDLDVMSLLGDDMSDVSVATNTTTCSESSNISTMDPKDSLDIDENLLDEISNRDREDAKVSVDEQGQIKFSVWVSFAEIYNEQIYDLLEPMSKKKNAKRPCLKLSEDQNGSPYIKGLKYVHVTSADEAYRLMTIGQRNLKTACTKLNHNSSRSHCIFNIKILRVVDKDDPHVARVSMLSLCDLAGSERYSKSQTSGDRLKEAGNINTSLLTLGRCIETLRHNQGHKANKRLVPFRESKLTRLFQNFFCGRGKAIMFVNVNQCSSTFDETQHVFKFSAIASQVVVQQKPIFIKPKLPVPPSPNPIPRSSISWATPIKVKQAAEQRQIENIPLPEESDDDIEEEEGMVYTQENIDELVGVIEQLQDNLETEIKNKSALESKIRKEVCEEMMKQFIEIEERCSERIREREQMAEEFAEKRIQLLMEAQESKKKKKKDPQQVMTDEDDEWVSSVLLHRETLKVQKRDETISSLGQEVEELKGQMSSLKDSQATLQQENADLQQQLAEAQKQDHKISKQQDNKNTEEIEELKKKIEAYEEKIQRLEKEFLKTSEQQTEDSTRADQVENLTQQLQQSRQHIKDQETEIGELNHMLTEAGETFEQSQKEIDGLKELTQDYEKKIEQQAEAISVLERAASDSKVAIETADQSLTKREESVAELQSQIRNLEGDVNKYRNKARFFENQLVEREEEAAHWKQKLETAQREHAQSQEALIHGFTAEIGNYKSQLFKLKTQLCKSPSKSPGGSLMSPLGMLRSPSSSLKSPSAVEISPFLPTSAEKRAHISHLTKSAAKCLTFDEKESKVNDVDQQVKDLKTESDKNSAMVMELQHALNISKSSTGELEKKLEKECSQHTEAKNKITELEDVIKAVQKDDADQKEKCVAEILEDKNKELEKANEKIKELEPLMKDYFSKSKQVTDLCTSQKKLQEELKEKEESLKEINIQINDLYSEAEKKEKKIENLEQRLEELDLLNKELKDMLNKTATDLEVKQVELKALSPAPDKKQKAMKNHILIQTDDEEFGSPVIIEKDKEINNLSTKVSKLREGLRTKDLFFNETKEKCKELEFRIDEKEIESEELRTQLEGTSHKVENLQVALQDKEKLLTSTGEELAFTSLDVEKLKRSVAELKAENKKLKEEQTGTTMTDAGPSVEMTCTCASKVDKLNEQLKQTELDRVQVSENLSILEKKHSELYADAEKVKNNVSRLESLLVEKDKLLGELSEKLEHAKEEKKQYENQCKHQKESQNEVEKLKTLLSEKNEEIEMFTQNLNCMLVEKERDELVETNSSQQLKDIKAKLAGKDLMLSQCKKEIEEAKDTIQKLQSDNEQLQHRITEYKNKITELEEISAMLENINKQVVEKDNEIENLRSQIQKLKAEQQSREDSDQLDNQCEDQDKVETNKEEMEKLLEENESLKTKNEEFEKNVKELKEESKWKISEVESLEAELKSVRELLKVTVEKHSESDDTDKETELEAKETNSRHHSENIEQIEERLSDAQIEIAQLKSSEHTQKALHQKVKGELQEALLEVENNRSELERLRAKANNIKQLEDLVETMKAKLEKTVVEHENEVGSSPQKNVDKEKIEKLEHYIVKLEKQLTTSTEKIALHDRINTDLREEYEHKLKRKDQENKETEEKISRVESELESIKEQKQGLRNCLQKVQDELKRKCEEKDSQEAKIKDLKQELHASVESHGALSDELEERTREVEEMKEGLRSKKGQADENDEKLSNALNEIAQFKSTEHSLKALNHKLKGELQEALLNAENYTSESERLKSKVGKLEELDELVQAKTSELSKAEEMISELKQTNEELNNLLESKSSVVTETEEAISEIKLKVEELEKLLEAKSSEVTVSEEMIGELKLKKEELEKLVESKSSVVSESEETISELKQKIDRLESEKSGEKEAETEHDPLLQIKLNSVITKLNKTEIRNRTLIKEVTQLESCVARLQQELEEMKQMSDVPTEQEIHRRSSSFMVANARQSISSPSVKMELEKSKERVKNLSEQLKKASSTMQDWLGQFNEADKKLQEKTQELHQARKNIENLEAEQTKMSRKIDELTEQLNRKTLAIQDNNTADKEVIEALKETLEEQEAIMQQQDDLLESKQKELKECEADYKELQKKYQSFLESSNSNQQDHRSQEKEVGRLAAEKDQMKQQLEETVTKLDLVETELEDVKTQLADMNRKMSKAVEEKDKLKRVVKENNRELKEMEKSLTESRRQCEEQKDLGDPSAENRLLEARREWEKKEADLHNKLQTFREERDKLVSGLEVVLKKKDNEIKQHKHVIKQLKEKEIAITKSWHEERQRIADGIEDLNHHRFTVKQEQPDLTSPYKPDGTLDEPDHTRTSPVKSPVRTNSQNKPPRPSPPKFNRINSEKKDGPCENADYDRGSPVKSPVRSPMRAYSCNIPLQQSPPKFPGDIPENEGVKTEILELRCSPGSARKSSSKVRQTSSSKRGGGGARRGRKRNSPANEEENLPPLPKRRSLDQAVNASMASETSEDYSTHLQLDATPTAAAKTLKKTRKRNGSKLDVSKQQSPEPTGNRSLRSKSLRVNPKEVLQSVTQSVTRSLRSRRN